jgi:5-formyltetrahydrofolate cyclo-ligase
VHAPTPKSRLREQATATLASIDAAQRQTASEQIAAHLHGALKQANTILAYAALPSEMSLDPFITAALADWKTICIPRIDWAAKSMSPVAMTNLADDLETGRYDIRVPKPGCALVEPAQLDVILLPGLAFDRAGNRLGRGAGFYDRFISSLNDAGHRPTLIGVCHDAQIVDSLPTEAHDHRVDRVITERGPLGPGYTRADSTPDL